ncbi:MAG TPA: YjaG family protein [Arsenophonus sp.]
MLRNPIHLRLAKLNSWQHIIFMVCLCERMYPNYQLFCKQTSFLNPIRYCIILDLIWESIVIKDSKIDFDNQLEKFESIIPVANYFNIYGVYPAIDACIALSEIIHSYLSGKTLEGAIEVSKISIRTIAMFEMTWTGKQMFDEELKELLTIEEEWDIYRLLAACQERDVALIKGLKSDLREVGISNIGIKVT